MLFGEMTVGGIGPTDEVWYLTFHVRKRDPRTAWYGSDMADRKKWREVLDAEAPRWSSMSSDELLSKLHDVQVYEVEHDSKTYQVEVELLEDTDTYLHVLVAVDDGSLPASISPVTTTFIRQKPHYVGNGV